MWKALPSETSEKLEQVYDPSKKSKGRKVLPNSDYEVSNNTYCVDVLYIHVAVHKTVLVLS